MTSAKKTTKKKYRLLVLHGPNLNLLGEREPQVYGTMTLAELNRKITATAKSLGAELKVYQSNHEGKLIDLLHQHRKWFDAVVINPGAYTHYSYALRDAISSVQKPTAEVHLSDIKKREAFRQVSVIEPVCLFQISGLGWESYTQAIERLVGGIHGR
jgi:3-dehydroquinate dehydratase-2